MALRGSDSDATKEVAVVVLASLLSHADGWGHMHDWGGGWMWLWGAIMMALLIALLVRLIRSTGNAVTTSSSNRDPTSRAREILAERYARGEVSTEEYRERVAELR